MKNHEIAIKETTAAVAAVTRQLAQSGSPSDVPRALAGVLNAQDVRWLVDAFWESRVPGWIMNLDKIHAELVTRGHDRDHPFNFNAFGDDDIFAVSLEKRKIIVHSCPSFNFFYSWDGRALHVRRFFDKWDNERHGDRVLFTYDHVVNMAEHMRRYADDGDSWPKRHSLDWYVANDFPVSFNEINDPGYVLSSWPSLRQTPGCLSNHETLALIDDCYIPNILACLFGDE